MKSLLALAAVAFALAAPAAASAATAGVTSVFPASTSNSKGVAQTYRFSPGSTATVDRLNVYLDGSNTASAVEVGLYCGTASSAGAQCAKCVIASPKPGAWNRCSVSGVTVSSGSYYWLSLVQPMTATGSLRYREGVVAGGPATYLGKTKNLTTLPASWSNGYSWSGGYQASMFVDQSNAVVSTTPPADPAPTTTPAPTPTTTPTPAPTTTPAPTPTTTPTPAPTTTPAPTPTATPSPAPTATPTPTPVATSEQFPNATTTGVPAGWQPVQTRSTDLVVTTPGALVQDVRFTNGADIVVKADGVTIRRVDMQGGSITNQYGTAPVGCGKNMLVEDSTFEQIPGQYQASDSPVVGEGGYTARRIKVDGRGEGPRVSDCGPVTLEDSFMSIKGADPGTPECSQVHSDGVQAYGGVGAVARNNTIVFQNSCGTSPWFVTHPEANTGVYVVDRLLVGGGGYVFRQSMPGTVTGLRVIDRSWVFGPLGDMDCSKLTQWDAKLVNVDADYKVTSTVRSLACGG